MVLAKGAHCRLKGTDLLWDFRYFLERDSKAHELDGINNNISISLRGNLRGDFKLILKLVLGLGLRVPPLPPIGPSSISDID